MHVGHYAHVVLCAIVANVQDFLACEGGGGCGFEFAEVISLRRGVRDRLSSLLKDVEGGRLGTF